MELSLLINPFLPLLSKYWLLCLGVRNLFELPYGHLGKTQLGRITPKNSKYIDPSYIPQKDAQIGISEGVRTQQSNKQALYLTNQFNIPAAL